MSLDRDLSNFQKTNSQQDDFFLQIDDPELIQARANNWELYNDEIESISMKLLESHTVQNEIIETIIQQGSTKLYDKYVAQKIPQHSIIRTLNYLKLPIQMAEMYFDGYDTPLEEENEAIPIEPDQWRRYVANVEKKELVVEDDISQKQVDLQSTVTKYSLTGTRNFGKISKIDQDLFEKKQEHQKVDLSVPQEFDHETEVFLNILNNQTLRVLKERDMQMKFEKQVMDIQREKELKEQQSRLRMADNQSNKKQFTYDFDGKIIPLLGVKVEKLPNTIHSLGHNIIKDQQVIKHPTEISKDQNKLPESNDTKKKKQYQSTVINYDKADLAIEQFNLQKGVTLISNGNAREGPRALEFLGDQSMLSDPQLKVRLTKKEYENMVYSGNLSRQKIQPNNTYNFQKDNNQSSILELQDDTLFLKDLKQNTNRQKKRIHTEFNQFVGAISVKSQKEMTVYMHSLQTDNGEEQEMSILKERYERMKTMAERQAQKNIKSVFDDFNKVLVSQSHASKSTKEYLNLPIITSMTKQKQIQEYNRTLGQLTKNPRNRMSKIASQAKSYSHLPPPGYGNSMGHGINSGYNPEYDDKKQNQSIDR